MPAPVAPPRGARGLKHWGQPALAGRQGVAPPRGARGLKLLEFDLQITEVGVAPPRGARRLKPGDQESDSRASARRAPTRGAWIETHAAPVKWISRGVAPPRGARGLKQHRPERAILALLSRPHAGRVD